MTDPEHRGMGYATRCIEKVCLELSGEGKGVHLFYKNPAAGRIYKKLGFEDIGTWCIGLLK